MGHGFAVTATVALGGRVWGSKIIPLAERFTFSTSSIWRSREIFLCIMPIPPSRAKAMAISASVTVSMGELTRGIFMEMRWVKRVETSTSAGTASLNGAPKARRQRSGPDIGRTYLAWRVNPPNGKRKVNLSLLP